MFRQKVRKPRIRGFLTDGITSSEEPLRGVAEVASNSV